MDNNESKLNGYNYFDVTADIGFHAYGKSLNEAYENAGLAMFNVITDISKVKKEESREFCKAECCNSLFYSDVQ